MNDSYIEFYPFYKRWIDHQSNTERRWFKQYCLFELGSPSPETMFAKYVLQHRRCIYCLDTLSISTAVFEHFIPLCKGGAHDSINVNLSCRKCNQKKHSHLPHVFCSNQGLNISAIRQRIADLNDLVSRHIDDGESLQTLLRESERLFLVQPVMINVVHEHVADNSPTIKICAKESAAPHLPAHTELRINYHGVMIVDSQGTQKWKFKALKPITWKNAHETYLNRGYTTTKVIRDTRERIIGYVMHKPYAGMEQAA